MRHRQRILTALASSVAVTCAMIAAPAPAGAATYNLDTAAMQFAHGHYGSVPSLSVWNPWDHTLDGVSAGASTALGLPTNRASLISGIEYDTNYLVNWMSMVTGYNLRSSTAAATLTTAIDDTQIALDRLPNNEWGTFRVVMDSLEYREFAFSGGLYFTRRLQANNCSTCARVTALAVAGSGANLVYQLLVNGHNPMALNAAYLGLGASFLVGVLSSLWELRSNNLAASLNAQTTGVLRTYGNLLNALFRMAATMYGNFIQRFGSQQAAIRELQRQVGTLTNRVRQLEAHQHAGGPPVVRVIELTQV